VAASQLNVGVLSLHGLVHLRLVTAFGGALSLLPQFTGTNSNAEQSSTVPTARIVFIVAPCINTWRVGKYLRC
jgi:hypothetical protein